MHYIISRERLTAAVAGIIAAALLIGVATAHAATFSVQKMIGAIDSELGNGNVVGYAFSIAKDGKVVYTNGHGKARNNADGNIPMGGRTRIDIMSATKNFTAISVLDLLRRLKVYPSTKVYGFLPPGFTPHSSWKEVTFEQLLNHTSGLGQQPTREKFTQAERDQWGTLYMGVKFAVSKPVVTQSDYDYTNMNYAVLRLAMERIWKQLEPHRDDLNYANPTALRYLNEKFLSPMGIDTASCGPGNKSTAALAYDIDNKSKPGRFNGLQGKDLEACGGHRGLWVSVADMTQFLANVQNLKGVSYVVRDWQNDGKLGWDPDSNSGYYWHGGDFLGTYRVHTCVAAFPNNVQVSLITNSANKTGRSACRVLIDSYKKGAGIL